MSELNPNAKKWVEALRSGKYTQTRRYLRTHQGYCCLGVACEVARENGVPLSTVEVEGDPIRTAYNEVDTHLPDCIMDWLGLSDSDGGYRIDGEEGTRYLTQDNDDEKKTFSEIADIIESKPEGLFRD
jgi:hypothetical protein